MRDKVVSGLIFSILFIILLADIGPTLNGWRGEVNDANGDNHITVNKELSPMSRGGGNVKFLIYQGDGTNSCGRNSYVTIPKTYLTNNGIEITEMCSGTLNAAVLANYDVVYLGRSRGRGRVVAADVRNWVQAGGGIWSESCGMVDQQDPIQGGYIALEDMFGYTNRIGRGDNAGGFSFNKVGNHEIWDGVNSPVTGSNGLFDSELRDNNIAPQATRIGDANNRQSPMIFIYGRGRTYSGVGGNWDSNGNCQRYFLNVIKWLAVEITAHVDEVALRGEGGVEKVCYAEYRAYNLSVNITATRDLYEVSELLVYLDYNTTNATLGYNWTRGQFFKVQDPDGHVRFLPNQCSVSNDAVDRWWVNFTFIINFSFTHERQVDCFVDITANTGENSRDRFPYLFRVENDMELLGSPGLTGIFQGELDEGDWIRGSEKLALSDLKVRYAGSANIYPEDGYFDVRVMDSVGNSWWDNDSKGENIDIGFTSINVTDPDEEYLITIENIPGSGICMTNLTFPVKIDAEAPLYPVNLICHAGGFKDKETGNTDQPEMYVTWDAVEDPASGLLGYYYSQMDDSGTTNGTLTNDTEVKIDKLTEGEAEIYVWCVDKVGNIGEAATSSILVDLTAPVFSNHTPMDGSWHNHTDIDCSVEVYDGDGAGVDGSTIEYSVSVGLGLGSDLWIPAWVAEGGNLIIPSVKYIFPEGEDNYIKWRAKDISGNGFAESSPVNLKVDVTPVNFAKEISSQKEWYDLNKISTTITVSDAGSGVDLTTLGARISTEGQNSYGQWMPIDPENITEAGEDTHEITVTFSYAEGKDNYIMFRGTDVVGNPFTLSDKFNLKIDTFPVYFGTFTPGGDEYGDSETVECFIQILDDGSGVDPATVEYSVANGAGGDRKSFGPWKKAENVVSGNPAQVLVEVEFKWGKENFIRWRADDLMGTGYNESREYRVWVNSRPEAIITDPEQGVYFRFDSQIFFDASGSRDEDGDNLSYYWSSNVSANRSIGSKVLMRGILTPGKHTITLFVSDGHGYNVSEKVKIEVGATADYERDSDGDGFSDGLEREKGTDPHNGAHSPPGKPDIVETETAGILSKDSSLLLFILGGILLLIILIGVIFFIVRKRMKKEEKEVSPSVQAPIQHSVQGQAMLPHPRGQYMSPGQQGYGGSPQFQAPYVGMAGGQGSLPLLPHGPDVYGSSQLGQAQAPQQPLYNQTGPGTDLTAGQAYALPSFTTEQVVQNLERMALPPAPASMEEQTTINTAVPSPMTSPDLSVLPPTSPDIGAMGTLFSGPPSPSSPPGEISQFPPEGASIPTASQAPAGLSPPTAGISPTSDLSELDAYLSSLDDMYKEPTVPAAPPVPEGNMAPPAPEGSSSQLTNEITMNHQQTGLLVSSSVTADRSAPLHPSEASFLQEKAESASPLPRRELAPEGGATPKVLRSVNGPTPPDGGGNRRGFLQMQCHSCGNNYMAEIAEFPALVTCPVCQTQGVINSI